MHLYDVSNEEHSLEHTCAYKEYEALLEGHLCDFSTKEGFESVGAFYEAFESAAGKNERSAKMVDILVASCDYEKFNNLMRLKAKALENRWRKDAAAAAAAKPQAKAEAKGCQNDDASFYDDHDREVSEAKQSEYKQEAK